MFLFGMRVVWRDFMEHKGHQRFLRAADNDGRQELLRHPPLFPPRTNGLCSLAHNGATDLACHYLDDAAVVVGDVVENFKLKGGLQLGDDGGAEDTAAGDLFELGAGSTGQQNPATSNIVIMSRRRGRLQECGSCGGGTGLQ